MSTPAAPTLIEAKDDLGKAVRQLEDELTADYPRPWLSDVVLVGATLHLVLTHLIELEEYMGELRR